MTLAPPSLADAVERWALADPAFAAETATSVIYRVAHGEHGPAALKLLKPGAGDDEARGGAMLAWYGGHGAARVFGLAPDAVLMEWLPGETLGDVARAGRDDDATLLLAEAVERLHARRDAPHQPRSDEQFVAGDLGVGRVLAQGSQEESGHSQHGVQTTQRP